MSICIEQITSSQCAESLDTTAKVERRSNGRLGSSTERRIAPVSPESIEDAGLSASFLSDLIIKHLYRFGILTGGQLAQKICLPFPLLDGLLNEIVENHYTEKRGGRGLGNSANRFSLTEQGRNYARDVLNLDTYIGPAPVPLDQYHAHVTQQTLSRIPVTDRLLQDAWEGFILEDEILKKIGPAIRSGKSCFLYGPPGTGKTTLAKKVAEYFDRCGGSVAVPHALLVGGSVIRVYDPVYHQRVTDSENEAGNAQWLNQAQEDARWVVCRRPAVVCGGELTLDMLDLRYNPTTRYYEAPFQLKANGGVLIIDDFGRQLVTPRDLLNRWIVPLEEGVDYMTLHTGKKFCIPFEQFVVFSTNLDPMKLADEAFLRRIRYKIFIAEPSVRTFKEIFRRESKRKSVRYNEADLDTVIQKHYVDRQRPFRACDPRDITDLIIDFCSFQDLPLDISRSLLDKMFGEYHIGIQIDETG